MKPHRHRRYRADRDSSSATLSLFFLSMERVDEAVGVGAGASVVTSAPGVSAWISVTGWESGDSTSAPGVGGGSKTTGGEGNSTGIDASSFTTSTPCSGITGFRLSASTSGF